MTEPKHELIVGASGSGKTTFRSQKVPDDAKLGAVVMCDPQKSDQSFSARVLPILLRAGLWRRVVFEMLSATMMVLAWQILKPSANPDPIARAQADEDAIRALGALVARRSGKPLNSTPMIEEWLIASITMVFASGAPFSILPYCFLPESEEFRWMLENHRERTPIERRNKLKWQQMATLYFRSPKLFHDQVMHAARRVEAVFTTRFLLRCDGSFDLEGAIRDGKILIFQGDTDNEDATRTLLGSIIYRVIANAVGSSSPRCRLIVDECNNFGGMVDDYVASALATRRQSNLSITLMAQHLNFPSEDILNGVMTNCQAKYYMRMGDPKTAEYCALDVGIPNLDFTKVLRTTERVVRTGEHEGELDGRKILRPDYGIESVEHIMQTSDQIRGWQQKLMNLEPGEVVQKIGTKVDGPTYVPLPEGNKLWKRLKTEKARAAMAERERKQLDALVTDCRSKPPFSDPRILMQPWTPPAKPPDPAPEPLRDATGELIGGDDDGN